MVFRQDQSADKICTVYRGWLYRYRKLANGRQQIIRFIIPGDTIPFFAGINSEVPLNYGVKSVNEVQLCSFGVAEFRHLLEQDQRSFAHYKLATTKEVRFLHQRIADIGQRNARGRLAQLLVELFWRHKERGLLTENAFEFPVSQALLAKALGLTKAYVNRNLAALKSKDIIRLQNKRLEILDLELLTSIAERE